MDDETIDEVVCGKQPQANEEEEGEPAVTGTYNIIVGPKGTTSSKRGVSYNRKSKKWQSVINVSGKHIHLGTFTDEVAAAMCFDRAAILVRGESAKLNYPIETYTKNGKDPAAGLDPDVYQKVLAAMELTAKEAAADTPEAELARRSRLNIKPRVPTISSGGFNLSSWGSQSLPTSAAPTFWDALQQVQTQLPEGAKLRALLPYNEERIVGVLYDVDSAVGACLWNGKKIFLQRRFSSLVQAMEACGHMIETAVVAIRMSSEDHPAGEAVMLDGQVGHIPLGNPSAVVAPSSRPTPSALQLMPNQSHAPASTSANPLQQSSSMARTSSALPHFSPQNLTVGASPQQGQQPAFLTSMDGFQHSISAPPIQTYPGPIQAPGLPATHFAFQLPPVNVQQPGTKAGAVGAAPPLQSALNELVLAIPYVQLQQPTQMIAGNQQVQQMSTGDSFRLFLPQGAMGQAGQQLSNHQMLKKVVYKDRVMHHMGHDMPDVQIHEAQSDAEDDHGSYSGRLVARKRKPEAQPVA